VYVGRDEDRVPIGWVYRDYLDCNPNATAEPVPKSVTPRNEPRQQQASVPSLVSSGSGFFVTTEGHIVTNAHVVADCAYVRSSRGGQISRLAIDEASDLAIYVASEKTPFAARLRGGRGPRVAEPVVAVGFPLKGLLSSDAIITTGIISALAGPRNDRRIIQITAPVQPGNSGGPLLGENGSVVGVVVGKLDALKMALVIGDIPQNVNFAVSLGTLQSLLNANGVPYAVDDSNAAKTSAEIAADASRYTVLLECFRAAPAPASSSPPTGQPATTGPETTKRSHWRHNGSLLYLVAEGDSRKFFYEKPRPGIMSEGARPGSILFSGKAVDNAYAGTAYIFKRQCGEFGYEVSGPILDNYMRVILRGRAPRVDSSCKIIGYFDDELEFSLMR
jgi:trypsin-like peptidase